MTELKNKLNTSMILITHDLGVAQVCDKVAIMAQVRRRVRQSGGYLRAGEHPYTIGLLFHSGSFDKDTERLSPIAGPMPDPTNLLPDVPSVPDVRIARTDAETKTRPSGNCAGAYGEMPPDSHEQEQTDTVRPEPDGSARQDDRREIRWRSCSR